MTPEGSIPVHFAAMNQAEIEQATGLSREVLRKWELRYQFPLPERACDRRSGAALAGLSGAWQRARDGAPLHRRTD